MQILPLLLPFFVLPFLILVQSNYIPQFKLDMVALLVAHPNYSNPTTDSDTDTRTSFKINHTRETLPTWLQRNFLEEKD